MKRGRPPLPESEKQQTKNITVEADLVEVLNKTADKLSAGLGFRPTLSQTIRYVIKKMDL
jgi:hypothetical protein